MTDLEVSARRELPVPKPAAATAPAPAAAAAAAPASSRLNVSRASVASAFADQIQSIIQSIDASLDQIKLPQTGPPQWRTNR
jgi:hypothetical protein